MARRVYPNLHEFFRDNEGLSATKLANELGIAISYLSMIKWGTRQPPLPLALRIARRCNVPLESLIRKPNRLSAKAS